ncbi:MAG TPA: pantetheine-phosphate adenylyltransferase [Candidatus Marinimicrobia bacterium]|nr:pantetheine-phosphate adenylyltransferase [Candidatus Neomarinimicrobiota bacterium]
MKLAIYPGTFDPITNGHLDILERAAAVFETVYIAVANNIHKDPLFSTEERIRMIKSCTLHYPNVRIAQFDGLVVDLAQEVGASIIIRGLRAISDFDYEFQMALMNRHMNDKIDTVFFMPHEDYTYLSSSTVREIVRLGGDVSAFVPKYVKEELIRKLRNTQ